MQKHGFLPYFDIGDCGFDIEKVFNHIRSTSPIPIIDYNQRNEKTDIKSLRKKGYDRKETPFAPCGLLCKPNGYDKEKKLESPEVPAFILSLIQRKRFPF